MASRADDFLKYAIGGAAILAGLSIANYYTVFLPNQARTELTRRDLAESAKEREQARIQAAKVQREQHAKEKYDACLGDAHSSYSSRWEATCRRLNGDSLNRRAECKRAGYADNYCASISITPSKECSLPTALANDYDTALQQARQQCLEEMKAATATSSTP